MGAGHQPITAELVVTVCSEVLVTVGRWWTYFDSFAATAQTRLREHDDPVLAAADGYSYLHLLIVAGIIVFAAGMRLATHRFGAPLAAAPRVALCGGMALYLVGHAAFRLRLAGSANLAGLAAAGLVGVVYLLASGRPAWLAGTALAVVLGALCVYETRAERRRPGEPGPPRLSRPDYETRAERGRPGGALPARAAAKPTRPGAPKPRPTRPGGGA